MSRQQGGSIDAIAQAVALLEQRGVEHVKIGITDVDGVMRGKYVATSAVLDGLRQGLTICDCVLGWDCDDQLYGNQSAGITGWHTGFPDTAIRLLPETMLTLPGEFGGKGVLLLCEFAGKAAQICPRRQLRQAVERAHGMGYAPLVGFEYEFSVFAETRDSIRAKHYRDLNSVTPGNFGYSILRTANLSAIHEELLAACTAMDVPLLALHTENGPGVWEAAIAPSDPLRAADRAAVFKTFSKALLQKHGLMATFMAKWSVEHQGQGGHMHISLRDVRTGMPVFAEASDAAPSSPTLHAFVAGQLALMPELVALSAPTVNSYVRLAPGAWAPTTATWGEDNRTCALRVVGRSASARRVEYRVAGADANPYLALTAALSSGLYGIEQGLEPSPPVTGNAYEQELPNERRLPSTLWEAAQRLKNSTRARTLLGDAFVDHFAASREWEEARRRQVVSDWELERYFEII